MKLNKANTIGSISVLIPKPIIQALNWNVGDNVEWELTNETNVLKLKKLEVKEND